MVVLKTWLDAWTTSSLHEHLPRACIFGRQSRDETTHYLVCPRLWRSIACSMQCVVPTEPYERLGMADLDYMVVRGLRIALATYHTIKQGGGYDAQGNVEGMLDIYSIAKQTKRITLAAHCAALAMLRGEISAVYARRP